MNRPARNSRCALTMLSAVVALFLCLLQISPSAAEDLAETLHFRQLNENQGLSQGTVRAIAQDHQGFIWLGTQDGLFRFDGQSLLVHRLSDRAGLTDNHILSLVDTESGLWIGTNAGGLVRFRPDSGFEAVTGMPAGPLAITALSRSDNEVFAAISGVGLVRIDQANGRASAAIGQPAAMRFIQTIAWRDGLLVLGCRDGLWLWREGQPGPVRVALNESFNGGVTALAFARDGRLWVGLHESGVRLYNPNSGVFDSSVEVRLTSPQVRSLVVDRRARVWVGTEDGLNRFDPSTRKTLQARHDADSPTSLPANRLPALFEDDEGLVWAGSWTNGVGVYRPDSEAVRLFRRFADVPHSLPANPIRALLPEPDGTLWLGVLEQGGLVHFDPVEGVIDRFRHDPNDLGSLPDDRVESLLRRRDGSLWVGTGNAGLAKLENGRFTRFQVGLPGSEGLPGNRIGGLYEDPDEMLWVGLIDSGLVTRCKSCTRFSTLDLAEDSPVQQILGRINQILRTRDGIFWLAGMPNGLYRYDPVRRWLTRYLHHADDPSSISHDSITVLVEDRRGRLWVGTQGGGLILAQRNGAGEAESFRAYTRADGLSADAVGGLLEAPDGALWAATIDSISRLNPDTGALRSLDASNGEISRGYFIGASAIGADGVYYFGGLRGITALRPELMPPPRPTPVVRITEFFVDNVPYLIPSEPGEGAEPSAAMARTVTLQPGVSSIGMEFAALEFLAPESLLYEYRMLGLDEQWVAAPANRRFAGFTRLPPGDYRFEVRARRAGLDDGYELAALQLQLLPPWWATPMAYLGYILAAGLLIGISTYRIRTRQQRDQQAQTAVRISEERLKFALWGSGDELWDIDLDGQQMHRENILPGLKISTQTPRSAEEFIQSIHPEDRAASEESFRAHALGARAHYEAVYRTQAEDGRWRWLLARGRAVQRGADGKALRVAGTVRDITATKANEDALKRFADELESRVEERTADHRMAISQLKRTVQELTLTQKQLVESEKMASLGQLVAGVAHEINTPIGIGVTAASHLQHETDRLLDSLKRGSLGKAGLQQYTDTARDSAKLLMANLTRASELIRSFKQVAVDQSSEQKRRFYLRQYLDETLLSLLPKLKRTKHRVSIDCPPQLQLETYPGALYQIVVNLLMNSLIHGFDGVEQGEINIHAEVDGDALLLSYRDNGKGMDESVRARVFDPFFTTKRQEGGSGLGMHLVYNLVTQLLKGNIEIRSAHGRGVNFLIAMPGVVVEGGDSA